MVASGLERAVEDGFLVVEAVGHSELAERLERNSNLSDADVAVTALAEHSNAMR